MTPQIEMAFPDRFSRDDQGRLQRIDARPLNFAEARQQQVRWGINFTRPLGPVPPGLQNIRTRAFASEAEARRALPGAVFTKAEPGSAMARSAANMTSRVFVSLYHNWYLEDAITLRGGLPALDLLNGGAVNFGGGDVVTRSSFRLERSSAAWGPVSQLCGGAGRRFARPATICTSPVSQRSTSMCSPTLPIASAVPQHPDG
ncbi:hypothetical protein P0F65_12235 [Sphingomonas sp. I4]